MEPSEADQGRVRPLPGRDDERKAWARLRGAESAEAFWAAWLDIQCGRIADTRAGLLLGSRRLSGRFEPLAVWPEERPPDLGLLQAAERVVEEGRPLALRLEPTDGGATRTLIANPVEAAGELAAVAALEVGERPQAALEADVRQLAWGGAWLTAFALEGAGGTTRGERLASLLDLLAAVIEQPRLGAATAALASELASRLVADRVAVGLVRGGRVQLSSLSHSSGFDPRSNLSRALEAAMLEAFDQGTSVTWPEPADVPARVTRAHAALAEEAGTAAALSVPFALDERVRGVVTVERPTPVSAAEREWLEAALAVVGPFVELRRLDERTLLAKARDVLRRQLGRLLGPRDVGLKLALAGAAGLLLFLAAAHGDYRVTADAVLEAQVLRAAVAPFEGYVAEAPVRSGDRVAAGDLLAALEDRALSLERERWSSELDQLMKEQRRALAERNAALARILGARIGQARARMQLADRRLERTRLSAPFDGIVVTGDLSQRLGAPVERGEVLFEVAPLHGYRVVLAVDERDIAELAKGQLGALALSARPNASIPVRVERITPVPAAREGRNTFRVEAAFEEVPTWLRPGMEGVGKVGVGRRRLLWIWTHEAVDWLRLALWTWLP
jgi:hypothetical protein